MKKLLPMLCVAMLMASYPALAQSNEDVLNSQSGKAAAAGYNYQQQQQQQQQMREYQNQAGSYNPGATTTQIAPNTYVNPTYNNGAVGGQITHTFK
jgi:hypothetical protein